jgi:hypothetical protein
MITEGLADICTEILYDCEPLGGMDQTNLFWNPLGGMISGRGIRKTYRDTNMYLSNRLPSPNKFLIVGIRCVFLEPSGEVVPIKDEIYWDSILDLYIANKSYWKSPIAHVVDPIILTTPEQWKDMSHDRKVNLMRRFSRQNAQKSIEPDRIANGLPFLSLSGVPEIDGVMIDTQQPFKVIIQHSGKYPDRRILCVLQGTAWRPVF